MNKPKIDIGLGASITGPRTTQEDCDRIGAITGPMAHTLLNLPPQDRYNVMGSLLASYGFSFSNPAAAIATLAARVLQTLPEAQSQMDSKPS